MRLKRSRAQDAGCERLMSVPGIGPIISSAMVVAIGAGNVFTKGRDFAAWLGLVPKQISTGDRTILGKIFRRGNRYLRVLFVQAAWVVLVKPKIRERHGLKPWKEAAPSQRAGDRTRQQTRPHRLERSSTWSLIRSRIAENIASTSMM
jgi:transposase